MTRTVVVAALALTACHPLAVFVPPSLSNDAPRVLHSTSSRPHRDVRVVVDDLAIPHIYGDDDDDLAYGLGVMHGRDRGFQIYLLAHAAEGRLTEMLGEDALAIDRENRLLSYRIDEQINALSARDRSLIESYCAGVNDGERMVGDAPELHIFGVRWEPLKVKDVVAIWRFSAWSQSEGLNEELARFHLIKALGAASPVTRDLLRSVPSGGVPIVPTSSPTTSSPPTTSSSPPTPTAGSAPPACCARSWSAVATSKHDLRQQTAGAQSDASAVVLQSLRHLASGGSGASNSWSVAPEHTKSGVAVLANDPHLPHYAPGVFYLVDLEDNHGLRAAGGTFPGVPIVIIGHGRDVAWGLTNAYADTQDAVIIEPSPHDANRYVVDGVDRDFGKITQRFTIGSGKSARVVEETWRTTLFGPVLPKDFGKETMNGALVDDGETFALLWTGFEFPRDNGRVISAMWDLAASRNVDDATRALQDAFAAPAMSFNLAFTDGTIAYRLSGIVPVRADGTRADFPRNGTSSRAGWSGRLSTDEKPQLTRPQSGIIVAANQRVVDDGAPAQAEVGFEANQPWRALRIAERVRALFGTNATAHTATDDLFAIEQDITAATPFG